MQHMGIQEDQHPLINNGKCLLPLALYYLGMDEKKFLCEFLEEVKMPDGYASCFSGCRCM
jgi:hypothetical protein